jgi:hypothetical protein
LASPSPKFQPGDSVLPALQLKKTPTSSQGEALSKHSHPALAKIAATLP